MIFGSPAAYDSRRQHKLERREVYAAEPATPAFLDWSGSPITLDHDDHSKCVPQLGRYPLVVDPTIGNTRLTKVLMDGGSGLNIIYAKTLDAMRISRTQLRPSGAPFHGIVSRKRDLPLGQINLSVTFGDPSNFREETLTFEVVGFRGTYHTMLGRPCYAKFMAILNYTYLKLKMSGLNGVITVHTTYQHAYECDVECYEYAKAIIESEVLAAELEARLKEAPDPKRSTGSFKPAERVKEVPLDPSGSNSKTVHVGTALDPK
jgi:hypothetical protein